MSENIKVAVSESTLIKIANEIGSLVIDNGLSYNQTETVFNFVLNGLKDVPYCSFKSNNE